MNVTIHNNKNNFMSAIHIPLNIMQTYNRCISNKSDLFHMTWQFLVLIFSHFKHG